MSNDRREFLTAFGGATVLGAWVGNLNRADGAVIPADLPGEPPKSADLGTLFSDVERLAAGGEYDGSFLHERFTALETFRGEGRARVLDALAYRPPTVEPLAEIVDRVDVGDHIREKIIFSTSPTMRVPAYVLIPKGLNGPAPAVVDLHSHGGMFLFGKEKVVDLGRNLSTMVEYHRQNYEGRPTATALVKRGYVVMTIDAFMFGERRLQLAADAAYGFDRAQYSAEVEKHLNQQCRNKESTLVKGLTLAGLTWPGLVTWDDIRTVDYLVTRPEVDPLRIGSLGVSFGGHRTLFLAALDERIRAACIAGFMSTVRPMIRSHLDIHSFVHFIPQLHRHLDLPDVASLRAPLPLMVLQCAQDGLFPPEGMRASVDKLSAIYRKADAAEQFVGRFYDIPHRFSLTMQEDAFAFLDRHLKG